MRCESLLLAGFPDYSIYEDGTIINHKTGRVIEAPYSSGQVTLKNALGEFRSVSLARLVAEAFVPNPGRLPYPVPKDGNNRNYRADNWEWSNTKFRSTKSLRKVDVHKNNAIKKRPEILAYHVRGFTPAQIAHKLSLAVPAVRQIISEFEEEVSAISN